jgi:hypothetical protein
METWGMEVERWKMEDGEERGRKKWGQLKS